MSYAWIKFWHGDNWGFWHCFHYYRNFTLSIKPNVHDTKNGGLLIVLHVRVHICFFLITNRIQLVFQHRLERRFLAQFFFVFFLNFLNENHGKLFNIKRLNCCLSQWRILRHQKSKGKKKNPSICMWYPLATDWIDIGIAKVFPFFQTLSILSMLFLSYFNKNGNTKTRIDYG